MFQFLPKILLLSSALLFFGCVKQPILVRTLPPYSEAQLSPKTLLIAPIPSKVKIGSMMEEDSTFLNQYYNYLVSNLPKVVQKQSTFKKVYYSDFDIYAQLSPVTLHLTPKDSFTISLPTESADNSLKKQFSKLHPDFVLFFEMEKLDYALNAAPTAAQSGISFRFSLLQQFKFAFWDVKQKRLVCYGRKTAIGDLWAVGQALIEQTPFKFKGERY